MSLLGLPLLPLSVLRLCQVRISMVLLCFCLQGCFYLVEEGKGGVAERFPIPSQDWSLSQRLHRCEAALTEHSLHGQVELYPALYRETQTLLMQSRRLYKAEFYPQAELALEPVEQVLHLMQQGLYLKAVNQLCHDNPKREVCL